MRTLHPSIITLTSIENLMLNLPLQMGFDPHAAAVHHQSSAISFRSVLSISLAMRLLQAPCHQHRPLFLQKVQM